MKILHETDEHQFVQYPNEVHALGVLCALGTFASNYGGEQLFTYVERSQAHIRTGNYAILQAKGAPDAPISVPVAFVLWAFLSKPVEVIYTKRFRPLMPLELKSGPNLWRIDTCSPFGHTDALVKMFHECHKDHAEYWSTRWREKGWRVTKHRNFANGGDDGNSSQL